MRLLITVAMLAATPVHAAPAVGGSPWSVSLSGGATAFEGAVAQPYAQVGIKHEFGDSFARVSGAFIGGGTGDPRGGAVPADTWQLTLGAGTSFGALSLEGHVLAGIRSFDRTLRGPAGTRRIAVASDGNTFGAGAELTADLGVGDDWFVSPFVSADYSRVDEALTATGPNGVDLVSVRDANEGVTGTGGVTVQRLIGGSNSIAGYAAFAATTNAASVNRQGSGAAQAAGLRFVSDDPRGDSWFEYGGSASFAVGRGLRLDLAVIRTQGLVAGDTTSGAATVRVAF